MAGDNDTIDGGASAAVVPPVVEPAEDVASVGVPRDERRDSIDPATGTLTLEAQALRRADA